MNTHRNWGVETYHKVVSFKLYIYVCTQVKKYFCVILYYSCPTPDRFLCSDSSFEERKTWYMALGTTKKV